MICSGSIPDSIGELSNLRILNLNNNELTGKIGTIRSFIPSSKICIKYTGHIPAGVGDLTRLQSLGLHMNKLTGNFLVIMNCGNRISVCLSFH